MNATPNETLKKMLYNLFHSQISSLGFSGWNVILSSFFRLLIIQYAVGKLISWQLSKSTYVNSFNFGSIFSKWLCRNWVQDRIDILVNISQLTTQSTKSTVLMNLHPEMSMALMLLTYRSKKGEKIPMFSEISKWKLLLLESNNTTLVLMSKSLWNFQINHWYYSYSSKKKKTNFFIHTTASVEFWPVSSVWSSIIILQNDTKHNSLCQNELNLYTFACHTCIFLSFICKKYLSNFGQSISVP